MGGQTKKIQFAEGLLMVMVAIIMDLLDLLIFLLEFLAVGVILDFLVDILNFLLFKIWFQMRKMPNGALYGSSILETIPILPTDVLPIRTFGVIFSIIIANNPKLMKLASRRGKTISQTA